MNKKEKILSSALELFANYGYNGVSTNKIAKEAGVSEGLIFRHFKNKEGLLNDILQLAFEKAANIYEHIIVEENPKQVLRKTIIMPFQVEKSEYDFWKLQFKLKWELEISGQEKMQPLLDKLTWAFEQLGYNQPEEEAQILQYVTESISAGILKEGIQTQQQLKGFLLKKYDV